MWESLQSESEFKALLEQSDSTPFLLFKHSTRCPLSAMVKRRFEADWNQDNHFKLILLDLIRFRSVSNFVANDLGIDHQSPQVIVVSEGKTLWYGSHHEIDARSIEQHLSQD